MFSRKAIYIVTVNDLFVVQAWKEKLDSQNDFIHFVADDTGAFTNSVGLSFDASGLLGNARSQRYVVSTLPLLFAELNWRRGQETHSGLGSNARYGRLSSRTTSSRRSGSKRTLPTSRQPMRTQCFKHSKSMGEATSPPFSFPPFAPPCNAKEARQ